MERARRRGRMRYFTVLIGNNPVALDAIRAT